MRGIRLGTSALAVLALAGCVVAPPPGPSVMVMPGQGKNFDAFQADDAACRQFAQQQTGIAPPMRRIRASLSAVVGTVVGAAAGAAIGAAVGNPAGGDRRRQRGGPRHRRGS